MKRREFIAALGGAAAWPVAARTQQSNRIRRLGILMSSAEHNPDQIPAVERLRHRLEDLGWIEGRNLRIDVLWGEGNPEKVYNLAKQLVETPVDVIVGQGAITVRILRQETSAIPIVFWLTPDPVGQGFIASLA